METIIIIFGFIGSVIVTNLLIKYYLNLLFTKPKPQKESKAVVKSKLVHKL